MMHPVIFDDALLHLVRTAESRHAAQHRCSWGGGSAQSLTHLASYMAGSVPFQIVLTKQYNITTFLDDLPMYKTAGQQRKKVFLFSPIARQKMKIS